MDILTNIKNLVSAHYQWLFDGIGAVVVVALFGYFWKKKDSGQNQSVQHGTGIQAGRDVKIGGDKNGVNND